ncbi:MAG: DNA-processing protein DprA [Pseudomonadota bacterium]
MEKSGISSSHPPLPPISEEDLYLSLRLLRSRRVGPATFYRLVDEHGSIAAALAALPEVARAAGEPNYAVCPEGVVKAELKAGKRAGARLLTRGHAGYPRELAKLDDAPPLLWARGPLRVDAKPQIALVGARNASSLGTRMTRRLAAELGEAGFTVVSGLARGVDTAAHASALDTGTIAIVAGGADIVYPAENAELMGEIAKTGLILSEMPMGLQPQARHFPRRNRLISGVSRAVVVVEAAAKSGSLITANIALDQGREVFAVPGHPFDARASGCNMLIRDGAMLARGAHDIVEALEDTFQQPALPLAVPDDPTPKSPATLRKVAALHSAIIERLGPSPMAEDQLIRDSGAAPEQVSSALVDLELEGRIERQSGGLLSLKSA